MKDSNQSEHPGAPGRYCSASGDCGPDGFALRSDARTTQTTGFVLLGVGAAMIAGGALLYVYSPSPQTAAGAGSGVEIDVGVGRLSAVGRW